MFVRGADATARTVFQRETLVNIDLQRSARVAYYWDNRCLDVGLGEQEQSVQVLKHDHGELEEPQHVDGNCSRE